MQGLIPLDAKISVAEMPKIRQLDKVMGLVPEDYSIFRKLCLIDNEGN